LDESAGTRIGDNSAGAGNVISGNRVGIDNEDRDPEIVQGNLIGTDVTGIAALGNGIGINVGPGSDGGSTIGGTDPGARNVISGNDIGISTFSSGLFNSIAGNLVGTDVTGTQALGNGIGIDLNSSGNTVGGTAAGAGNLISGNRCDGLRIAASTNLVQGNFIGTDVTGTAALGNGGDGVVLFEEGLRNTIGGTDPGAGNVISANGGDGISTELAFTVIEGNLIGTDATGAGSLGNGGNGVRLAGTQGVVNTQDLVAGNVIAFSGHDGVLVDEVVHNAIQGNSIFSSGNLGIELIDHGNNDQAAPLMACARPDGTVAGALMSTPNTMFTIEFFANDQCNPSGFGEGQIFLGSTNVIGRGYTIRAGLPGLPVARHRSARTGRIAHTKD
jgi:titin